MDGSRFDDLARQLASGVSRRGLLKGTFGAALATRLGGLRASDAEAATCRAPDDVCRKNGDCCSALCGPADSTGRQRCVCPPGQVACNRACVDPSVFQSDVKNCGSCGTACPATKCQSAVCNAGVCGLIPNPAAVGRSCNDGNLCTLNDVCQADGSCAGTPKDCSGSSDVCNTGVCDPATGNCIKQPLPNTTTCNADNDACTVNDHCQAGTCVPGAIKDCSTLTDQCNTGVCDHSTGNCVKQPLTNGTTCDADSDLCTVGDHCQTGACVAGSPKDCSSLTDQCNTGICDHATGNCIKQPVANGTTCNADSNVCTVGDNCQSGTCTAGTPKTCPDRGPCFINPTCDPVSGDCSYSDAPATTTCADGDENCSGGFCCPAANRCATQAGDVCCPSGQTCSSFDIGSGTELGICCDSAAVGCITFDGTTPSLVCCASGQSCLPVDIGSSAPFPIGVCCESGATACATLSDSSSFNIEIICCPSGSTCNPISLGDSFPIDFGVCCVDGADACLTADFSTTTPSFDAVCCGSGESCKSLDFGSSGSGFNIGICCATDADACASLEFSGSTPSFTATCCGSGETCQSFDFSGLSTSVCCATEACPVLTLTGGSPSFDAVCCAGTTTCSTLTQSGLTFGLCCEPGETIQLDLQTQTVVCAVPCENPCTVLSGSTPAQVCCDPNICVPAALPVGSGLDISACCAEGQSACLDGTNFSGSTFAIVCCDECQTVSFGTTSFGVCCPEGQRPIFTGTGITCADENVCPVYTGSGVTLETCEEGTVCSTVSSSGFEAGACCPPDEQFGIILVGGTPTGGCCDASAICGSSSLPLCCTEGTHCVSDSCQPIAG